MFVGFIVFCCAFLCIANVVIALLFRAPFVISRAVLSSDQRSATFPPRAVWESGLLSKFYI